MNIVEAMIGPQSVFPAEIGPGLQQARPQHERNMAPYEREALDRARDMIRKNAMENPAICAILDRIESKMDRILKLLETR